MDATTGTVRSSDGTQIGWVRTGEGPPLVLVHGTTADHSRWAPVLAPLAARFTVYAVDRRGRGISGDTDPYAIEREFEDVAAVVDAIDAPVHLLGHSYGAVCSLEAAVLTRNLASLILYEPPLSVEGLIEGDVIERIDAALADGDRELALTTFFTEVARVPSHVVEQMRATTAWAARVQAAHTLTREQQLLGYRFDPSRFERLAVPTLLLAGGETPPPFSEPLLVLEKTLPNAKLVVLPGQKHVAMDTAPDLFTREVLDFLASV